MKKPLIGLSWLSYLPSLLSVLRTARLAKRMGYEFLQAAPTRGLPCDERLLVPYIQEISCILPILLLEHVWSHDQKSWGLLDRIAFERLDKANSRYMGLSQFVADNGTRPKPIAHSFVPGGLVELHPGLWLEPWEVHNRAVGSGTRLVLDTYHIRRQHFFGEQLAECPPDRDPEQMLAAWSDWREYLPRLAPFIEHVHVQPHRETNEQDGWLNGEPTELNEILYWVKTNCPQVKGYVVELAPLAGIVPKLKWLSSLKDRFQRANERLHQLLAH